MKYLIDTHILIWLAISPEKISRDIMVLLENKANEVYGFYSEFMGNEII